MSSPLVSVITVNYNNKAGLEKTIESVVQQERQLFEFIVMDGNSTDGSAEVIAAHEKQIDYWVSEKDKGVYDAMNKGIAKARGRYIIFMNSGDCFASSTVLQTVKGRLESGKADMYYGNILDDNRKSQYPEHLKLYHLLFGGICHQALFIKRELFDKAGLYDLQLPITADSCHMIVCMVRYNAVFEYIPEVIAAIEPDGMSTKTTEKNVQEKWKYVQQEFSSIYDDYQELYRYKRKDILQRVKGVVKRKLKK